MLSRLNDPNYLELAREAIRKHERIVVVEGTHGTGKSKLCYHLGAMLNCPVVDEIAREVLSKHGLDGSYKGCNAGRIAMVQGEIMDGYFKVFDQKGPLVVDRSTLSVYAYSLARLAHHPVQNELSDHYAACDIVAKDKRIIWCRAPIYWPLEHDGVRERSKHKQREIDYLIRGMLEDFGLPYFDVPNGDMPEERAEALIIKLFAANAFGDI